MCSELVYAAPRWPKEFSHCSFKQSFSFFNLNFNFTVGSVPVCAPLQPKEECPYLVIRCRKWSEPNQEWIQKQNSWEKTHMFTHLSSKWTQKWSQYLKILEPAQVYVSTRTKTGDKITKLCLVWSTTSCPPSSPAVPPLAQARSLQAHVSSSSPSPRHFHWPPVVEGESNITS